VGSTYPMLNFDWTKTYCTKMVGNQ
jgi:hypothetical protein